MITHWPYQVVSVPTSEQIDRLRLAKRCIFPPLDYEPTTPATLPVAGLRLAATEAWLLSEGWKKGDRPPSLYIFRLVLDEEDIERYRMGTIHWVDATGKDTPHQPEQPSFDISPSVER